MCGLFRVIYSSLKILQIGNLLSCFCFWGRLYSLFLLSFTQLVFIYSSFTVCKGWSVWDTIFYGEVLRHSPSPRPRVGVFVVLPLIFNLVLSEWLKGRRKMCSVNPGFILVGASLLCPLTLKVVVKGICLPMNSYHQFFVITGIPIRKKKKSRADVCQSSFQVHLCCSSEQAFSSCQSPFVTWRKESYWLTPRRISLHSILSIQGALGFETIKLVSIWDISERRRKKKLDITWIHLPCGPLLTSNHSRCQSQRKALYFNDWVPL